MAEKRNPLGPTGENRAGERRAASDDQNLGHAQLARKLEHVGRPIPELGLRRIESGARRVDADDLLALAAALDVPPATLLMPESTSQAAWESTVDATGFPDGLTGQQLWEWLTAQHSPGKSGSDLLAWLVRSKPWGALTITGHAPTVTVTSTEEVPRGDR